MPSGSGHGPGSAAGERLSFPARSEASQGGTSVPSQGGTSVPPPFLQDAWSGRPERRAAARALLEREPVVAGSLSSALARAWPVELREALWPGFLGAPA